MKINKKYYDFMDQEPILTQQIDEGVVEIHSMNAYPSIYNTNITKQRFTFWSSKGDGNYKLAIEDSYYDVMKDLYILKELIKSG